jgi:hypothetical protein
MKHLTQEQAETHLRLGKPLEQWLDRTANEGEVVLRWLRAERSGEEEYVVVLYEAIESDRARYDIYGLYAVERDEDGDPQQVFGAGKRLVCSSAQEAIARVTELGGSSRSIYE